MDGGYHEFNFNLKKVKKLIYQKSNLSCFTINEGVSKSKIMIKK